MNDLQLEMNFAAGTERNRLRDEWDRGNFTLLIENASPGRDSDPAAAAEKLAAWEQEVLAVRSLPIGLAITDGSHTADAWRAVEYAAALAPEQRDRHLIYLSGRNTDDREMRTLTQLALSAGLCNLAAVSGDAVRGESIRDTRRRTFTESVDLLRHWQETARPNLQCGAVVNPFQYTGSSLYPQYSKLMRKINCGARFIVTQAGWDMLKLQTIRWYLSWRGIFIPTVARLLLLTPERVEKIQDGQMPGVNLSPDFRKILDQELQFSQTQFEAAQWRRLELQAAGCRLLGYSGIQLSGIDNAAKLHTAAERIAAALQEFTTFEQWLEAYNSYLARAEMAPFTGSFYLFDRTLHRAYPETPPRLTELGAPEVTGGEKFRYRLRKFLFAHADRQSAGSRRLLKNIFCGCRGCSRCRLPQTLYLCVEQCPKRLANGPCGGIRPDGSCELAGAGECVHRRIMRLAHWRGEASALEDRILDSGRRTDAP